MPIAYERDDRRRVITVTVTDPYSVDDIIEVIDRQAAEDTWAYALLYDLRTAIRMSSDVETWQIAERVRVAGGGRERGPVAIAMAASPEQVRRRLAKNVRTVEMLLTTAQVDDWLTRNAPRRSR